MNVLRYKLLLIALLIVGCDNSTEPEDCAGVAGGVAAEDDCSVCAGGTTGVDANADKDCAGICNGGHIEVSGTCDCDTGVTADCAGVCGGTAVLSGCDNACNSTTIVDCAGICGGNTCLGMWKMENGAAYSNSTCTGSPVFSQSNNNYDISITNCNLVSSGTGECMEECVDFSISGSSNQYYKFNDDGTYIGALYQDLNINNQGDQYQSSLNSGVYEFHENYIVLQNISYASFTTGDQAGLRFSSYNKSNNDTLYFDVGSGVLYLQDRLICNDNMVGSDDCYECTDSCIESTFYETNSIPLVGCTDLNALNYSAMYIDNDGSCVYAGENMGDYCLFDDIESSPIGIIGCNMDCHFPPAVDGYCDSAYNCAEFNYDGGDCSTNYSNNGSFNKAKKEVINKFNNWGLFKLLGKRIINN